MCLPLSADIFDAIITGKRVRTLLQPIISLRDKRVAGVEALSRGVHPDTGDMVSPLDLFATAHALGRSHELDGVCLESALGLPVQNGGRLLFVNIDASSLAVENGNLARFQEMIHRRGIDPSMIAMEIVESRVESTDMLVTIVECFREAGFLIVLDDFGADHSNLDRIFQAKPDIIKIDRCLVHDVGRDFYKQSIIRSVTELANKIGTLTLAEGVEQLEDVIACYEMGTHLFQGFYFARPMEEPAAAIGHAASMISRISPVLYRHLELDFADRMLIQQGFNRIIDSLKCSLGVCNRQNFSAHLESVIRQYPQMECAYIIDDTGRQVGDTICRDDTVKPRHHLFSPAVAGTDHSLKTYYYTLKTLGQERYFTDPYISLATGNICRTIAASFMCKEGEYVLCVDFTE